MKRVYIALALFFVALVGVIVWQAAQPSEPVYKGRTLTSWLRAYKGFVANGGNIYSIAMAPVGPWIRTNDQYVFLGTIDTNSVFYQEAEADEALRHIGTNSVPTLLRFLRAKDSKFKTWLVGLAQRQRIIKIEYFSANQRNNMARRAFVTLGTNAQCAVPALIATANENIAPSSRLSAIGSLGYIGPPAKQAIPYLLQWTTNKDKSVRVEATFALRNIDPEAAAKAGITNSP